MSGLARFTRRSCHPAYVHANSARFEYLLVALSIAIRVEVECLDQFVE